MFPKFRRRAVTKFQKFIKFLSGFPYTLNYKCFLDHSINRDGNVAFKVIYTDSDWSGVCSPDLAARNFIGKECCKVQSSTEGNCQNSIFSNPEILNKDFAPCYDCIAQKEMVFYAGHFHSAEKDNEPKTALDIKLGKIALFTSKERGADETERFILL